MIVDIKYKNLREIQVFGMKVLRKNHDEQAVNLQSIVSKKNIRIWN